MTSQPPHGFCPCACDLLHLCSTKRGRNSYEAYQRAAEDKTHLGKHPLQTLDGWTLVTQTHPPTKQLNPAGSSGGHLPATCYQWPHLSLLMAFICNVKITSAWNPTAILKLVWEQNLMPNNLDRLDGLILSDSTRLLVQKSTKTENISFFIAITNKPGSVVRDCCHDNTLTVKSAHLWFYMIDIHWLQYQNVFKMMWCHGSNKLYEIELMFFNVFARQVNHG